MQQCNFGFALLCHLLSMMLALAWGPITLGIFMDSSCYGTPERGNQRGEIVSF